MIPTVFAAEEATGIGALGISPGAFVIQLITFVLVFLLMKKFAFQPIVNLLQERHKTIDDGVRMGLRMEKEKEKLDEQVAKAMRDARHEADQIIAAAHKDARQVVRDAEKAAVVKADRILEDAEVRIHEESAHARRNLESELVGLVSEATETIIGEKVDKVADAELVKRAMKGQK
ncbi:F0F1 ATP synthase subunit B [Candidatus Saccharibacteria bacterium]|nr:F0F1 ATP synthase subunit B [Candidatus Saccharibacteria bacterium]